MKHLDLFSGIGGFALAADWVWGAEHEIVSFCEIESFCQKVLKKHWPDVPIHDDIKTLKGDKYGTIDLITGGFPCQSFSVAGKRRGKNDDRYLWPEMFRIIQEARPRWVIGENVTGIINMALDEVLSDLESEGYEAQTFIIPACSQNAPHRRDRVWIVADTINQRLQRGEWSGSHDQRQAPHGSITECIKAWDEPWIEVASRFCGVDARVSHRVDRLKSLGNAIVPQVVVPIMESIKKIDEEMK